LRKKNANDVVTAGEIHPLLPSNGEAVRFDLLDRGQASPTGQLEISAVTNTEKYPPARFSWRAILSVPSGGLIEQVEEFPFDAPETGYQSTISFEMPATAADWKRTIEKGYFIRFGSSPLYARIQIHINGASQKPSITYVVNPSGSRNLEYDPAKEIKTK
jgi:hypothetical protein